MINPRRSEITSLGGFIAWYDASLKRFLLGADWDVALLGLFAVFHLRKWSVAVFVVAVLIQLAQVRHKKGMG